MKDNDPTQFNAFPYITYGKYTEVRNTGGDIGRTSMKDYKEDEANVRKSEWTKTFIVDGKYYTAPSIINGIEYTEDQLKTLYKEGAISADGPYDTIGKAIKSAKDHTEALGKTVLTSPYQQR